MELQSNIKKLYGISTIRWFMLFIPILVIFFQDNGLSMKEVLLLQAIFSISIVVLEIPSGYLSDIFNRKIMIIFGNVFGFFGFLAYSLSYNFWGFLLAEILLAIGWSSISGSDSALLYDTLEQTKQKEKYSKYEGRLRSFGNFSEGVASIIGGFLATISLRTPFYIETALMLVAIVISFSLIEPKRKKLKSGKGDWQNIKDIVYFSLHGHPQIKWLIIYAAVLGASTLTAVWFIQPYFKLVGVPLAFFGILWAALQFTTGISSWYAHKFENKFGRKGSLVPLIFLSVIAYIFVSILQSFGGILFLFIFYFVRGISGPVLKDYVNKLISSDKRATILSIKNMVSRLVFSLIGPFIGWANDLYSLSIAFLTSGGIFLVLGLISLIFLKRNKVI
jgi:MFS family permease